DPTTNSWSSGPPIAGAVNGIDNTGGATLGASFHVVGGFDGITSINTHWQLHLCNAGELSSAAFLPFVVDGDGTATGIGNERTALLIDNVSGSDMGATCYLYTPDGNIDSSLAFGVAADEVKTVQDVVRALRGASSVQNLAGSLAIFGTEVFHAMASVL